MGRRATELTACLAALILPACLPGPAWAAERGAKPLTVSRPPAAPIPPAVPSPLFPGAPIPWSGSPLLTPPDLSIVNNETRFLTSGPAEERCPGDRIVFVTGVVNPFRPTLPGDGAFMCRRDAIAEGFIGP